MSATIDRADQVNSWDRDRLVVALGDESKVRGLSGGFEAALATWRAWFGPYRIRNPLILEGLGGVHRPASARTSALVHGAPQDSTTYIEQSLLFDNARDAVGFEFTKDRSRGPATPLVIEIDTEAYSVRMPWPKGSLGEVSRPSANQVLAVSPFNDGDKVSAASFFSGAQYRAAQATAPTVRYTCAAVTVYAELPRSTPPETLSFGKARNWWEVGYVDPSGSTLGQLYLYGEYARQEGDYSELKIHLAWRDDGFWPNGPHQHQADPTPSGEGLGDWMRFVREALDEFGSAGTFRYAVATTKRYTQAKFLALVAPPI